MRVLITLTLAALAALVLGAGARADEPTAHDGKEAPAAANGARWDDTGRFYLLFQSGFVFLFDDSFAGDVHDESHEFPHTDHVHIPLSVGIGYNLSKHFGIELEGVGTEPDVKSDSLGKLAEYSN